MTGKSLRHVTHYLFLLVILIIGIFSMLILGKNVTSKITIIIFIGVSYFLWGIVHHLLEKDLHSEIIIEYFLFSVLGVASILGVLSYL